MNFRIRFTRTVRETTRNIKVQFDTVWQIDHIYLKISI